MLFLFIFAPDNRLSHNLIN